MASDAARGFLGGLLRSSVSRLANSVISTATAATSPYSVQEITGRASIDEVSHYPISRRDEFSIMLLHGCMDAGAFSTSTSKWMIIVHQPRSERMWILFRSNEQAEATRTFKAYQGLSALIKCDSTICEKTALEKICSLLRDPNSEGWTAAHIAAAFDYSKPLKNSIMTKYLNAQAGPLLKTPLHVAIESKNLQVVTELMNAGAQMDLKDLMENNIMHFAAKSSAEILKLVTDKHSAHLSTLINEVNREGMTPLAVACKYNLPENVQILLLVGSDVKVPASTSGYPITIAVKSDSVLSIQALVAHAPEQLNLRDPTDGSCPIHWAKGPETITMLLEVGSDPNITNNAGQTPLHVQTKRGCLKGALQLLCHEAFPDMKDNNGETPMHVAARLCSTLLLQVLIAFDGDVNLVNDRGESPRHLICTSQRSDKDFVLFYLDSVGARRCPESLQQHCTDGCKFDKSFKGIPPENYGGVFNPSLVHEALYAFSASREVLARSRRGSVDSDPGRTDDGTRSATGSGIRNNLLEAHIGGRLLCLDGGGIRGVVLTQVLMYMQREFGVPIVELFDWIAGTSTGGIMALCLATGKSPIEIQALYLRLKDKIFTGERPYSSEKMEEFLKQEFGSDTKMSNLKRPRLMITTAIANLRPADFHFFRNYLSPSVILGEEDCCTRLPEDLHVWEVAKATGAAPSYFRLDAKYIDGGLVSNNPTIDALTELTQFSAVMRTAGETHEIDAKLPSVVVSLGTGVQPRVKANYSQYDISKPDGFWDAFVKVPRIASIIALLVEQATQTEGQVVERARAWCASIGVPYFRFSPHLSQVVDLDETKDEVLVNLMWETRAYLFAHHASVLELKQSLFANGSPPPENP